MNNLNSVNKLKADGAEGELSSEGSPFLFPNANGSTVRFGEGSGMKETLASRLAEAREAKGMTPAQLSAKSGVSKSVISRLENEEREDLRLSDAARLCRALGISLDFLAGLTRSRSSATKVRKLLVSALSVIDGDAEG